MSTNDLDRENGHDDSTELEPRDARALTECMTVLPEDGDVFTVVGENGGTYGVDARDGRCTCDDYKYREPAGGCKHIRRVAFATGERLIPAWVDTDAVDEQLGAHTDAGATPRVAATDGGMIVAGDDGEILDESGEADADERPDDCECEGFHEDTTLPCWPCYREGFETPAPGEEEA